MSARIVHVNPEDPREDRLRLAVDVLRGGGIVSLPTETFYGLCADAFDRQALARLNTLKGKAPDAPILLLLADVEQASQVAAKLPHSFAAMAGAFWPGPLSLVVPAREGVPEEISAGRGTVGVRVPGLVLPRQVAAALGRPITGVSANLTGLPPCRTALDVLRSFPEGVEMILDGGPSTGGASSTVLDLSTTPPRILREGAIPASALRPFLGILGKNSV